MSLILPSKIRDADTQIVRDLTEEEKAAVLAAMEVDYPNAGWAD